MIQSTVQMSWRGNRMPRGVLGALLLGWCCLVQVRVGSRDMTPRVICPCTLGPFVYIYDRCIRQLGADLLPRPCKRARPLIPPTAAHVAAPLWSDRCPPTLPLSHSSHYGGWTVYHYRPLRARSSAS